jgi:outer membrane protein OmpA-like peptidoglycan-associated protein
MKNKLLLLITSVLITGAAQAQIGSYFDKFQPAKRWSLGLQLSPTALHGDADDTKIGLAYGAHVKYSVSQTFGIKLNGNIGTLTGGRAAQNISRNGETQYNQNINGGVNVNDLGNQAPSQDPYEFTNNFREVNINMVYTLGNISFLRPLRKLQMFVFTGFGAIWSDVEGRWPQGEAPGYAINTYNNPNPVLTYTGRNLTLPFGFGFKRNFGRWLDLGVEYRMNYTRSDNLDAFSFATWRNRYTDFYSVLGIQGSVKLGSKGHKDHYDWLNPVESIYEDMDSINFKVNGLTSDSDNDGVADYLDKDDETPEGVNVYGSGMAVDTDMDGVPDHEDDELFSDKGAEVDDKGVMPDKDKDGVPDYRDEDPNTPADVIVNKNGVATTTGGMCCDCEDVILPAIVFDNGSARIRPEYYGALYNVANKMKDCPDLKIKTIGYPVRGKANEQLSWKRTNAIIEFLTANYGITRNRFIVDYNGSSSEDLEYKGRRVDMKKAGADEKGSSNPPAPHPGM